MGLKEVYCYLILLLLESYHTDECDSTANNSKENEYAYTKRPIMKTIATPQKRTAASNQPHSVVSVVKEKKNLKNQSFTSSEFALRKGWCV